MDDIKVLIIGSGPAGINAAWPLVLAGIHVAMLDHDQLSVDLPPKTENLQHLRKSSNGWRYFLGNNLEGLYTNNRASLKFSTPIGSAVIGTTQGMYALELKNMTAVRTGIAGGLSSIWGSFCSEYDDQDLDGFPIGFQELQDSYEIVGNRIGISGANDDLGTFHGDNYFLEKPNPLTAPVDFLYKRYSSRESRKSSGDFLLGMARNAVITKDKNGRASCNQCGLCLYGCSKKSIYNSSYELCELTRYSNFKYLTGRMVKRFASIGHKGYLVEIENGQPIATKHLILAAGTINSTAMILEYLGAYGKKLPLLSNPVAASAYIVPKYIGRKFEERSFGLGQLSYRLGLKKQNEYAMGVIYGGDTLPLNAFASHMRFSTPVALKLASTLAPSLVLSTTYLPGSYSNNHISLEKQAVTNDLGELKIKVEGNTTKEAVTSLKFASKKLSRHLMACGAYQIPGSYKMAGPGVDAHLVGTIPMGKMGEFGCSNDGELNAAKGAYIADGSCLTSIPAKHCTFTIMANAHRIGANLAIKLSGK